jgi:hypothetical protein
MGPSVVAECPSLDTKYAAYATLQHRGIDTEGVIKTPAGAKATRRKSPAYTVYPAARADNSVAKKVWKPLVGRWRGPLMGARASRHACQPLSFGP